MEKRKTYHRVTFSARLIRKAIDACATITSTKAETISLSTTFGDEEWGFDALDEFFAQYPGADDALVTLYWEKKAKLTKFRLSKQGPRTYVTVEADTRADIEAVFSLFEEAGPEDRVQIAVGDDEEEALEPTIFIGHGRRNEWKDLKSHLQDKHNLNVVAYETGARAGHAVRDILSSLVEESSFALLVLTGEDKSEEGLRARQNVIHECGLFQGRLGFDRAIMLVEKGIVLASNFDGIHQLRFTKGKIAEVFGDVLATLKREFGPL